MCQNLLAAPAAAPAASNTGVGARRPSVPEAPWRPRQRLGIKRTGQGGQVRSVQDEGCAVYGLDASHKPLANGVVLALLATLLALGVSAWMMPPDAFVDDVWLGEVHEAVATGLLGLLAFHAAGAVLVGLKHRKIFIAAMTGGRKRPPAGTDIA